MLKSGRTLWIHLEERLISQGLQECLQWRFWDQMSFLKEYIVNRKLVKKHLHSVSINS